MVRSNTLLFLVPMLLAACSSSDPEAQTAPLSEDEYWRALDEIECSKDKCCTGPKLTDEARSACVEKRRIARARGTVIDPDVYIFDGLRARRCIDALRAQLGTCSTVGVDSSPCWAIFDGKVPAGGACQSSAECARPTESSLGRAYCADGRCWQEVVADVGGSCTSDPPDVYRHCNGLAKCQDGVCQPLPLVKEGEACDDTTACADKLYCNSGTCAPLKPFSCSGS